MPFIWDKVFKNVPSKTCGPLLGPFLNTLSHLELHLMILMQPVVSWLKFSDNFIPINYLLRLTLTLITQVQKTKVFVLLERKKKSCEKNAAGINYHDENVATFATFSSYINLFF